MLSLLARTVATQQPISMIGMGTCVVIKREGNPHDEGAGGDV